MSTVTAISLVITVCTILVFPRIIKVGENMSIDYKLIGQRIKSARKQCHLTQEQLAEQLSVTVGYVSQLERGITKINLDTLAKISQLLNCDITYFLNGTVADGNHYLKSEFIEKYDQLRQEHKRMILEMMDLISRY